MYTKRNYGFWLTFKWSKRPFIFGILYASIVTLAYTLLLRYANINIAIPWSPIGIIGTAVAFYLGFKNNASYDRTWEARKIWGGIVNNSRSFGMAVKAFVKGPDQEAIHRQLVYRHIAWLTALRYQLRLQKEWEHTEERIKGVFFPETTDKYFENLDNELRAYITEEEIQKITGKANMAAQILAIQGQVIQRLCNAGYFEDFRHMELHTLLTTFFDDQGKSERIKNFPFPRQYASAALWQTLILAILIPFGMLDVFASEKGDLHWLSIPTSGLIIWIFFLMEKIGDYSENPFEGSYNDIPITSISRAIEIDLREMIGDKDIPPAIKSVNGFLM
jgi:ion channel-forming bestrophin family protein